MLKKKKPKQFKYIPRSRNSDTETSYNNSDVSMRDVKSIEAMKSRISDSFSSNNSSSYFKTNSNNKHRYKEKRIKFIVFVLVLVIVYFFFLNA